MAPTVNRKAPYAPATAQKGEIPDDLIGRHYTSFTRQERDYVQTYREIHHLCLSYGAGDHAVEACSHASAAGRKDQAKHCSKPNGLAYRPKHAPKPAPKLVVAEECRTVLLVLWALPTQQRWQGHARSQRRLRLDAPQLQSCQSLAYHSC